MAVGHWGENRAHRYLQRKGYAVLARNWRYRPESGEIDIVAWKDDVLVFAEVKTRKQEQANEPLRQVSSNQQWRIRSAAENYVQRFPHRVKGIRFDILTVAHDGGPRQREVQIEHLLNAFDPFARQQE